METITYKWGIGTSNHTLELVYVPGTSGAPYAFGNGDAVRSIELPGFFIQTTPVTQALWIHVLGAMPIRLSIRVSIFLLRMSHGRASRGPVGSWIVSIRVWFGRQSRTVPQCPVAHFVCPQKPRQTFRP